MKLTVAVIGAPHGLKGEVRLNVRTDSPEKRFVAGSVFETEPPEADCPLLCLDNCVITPLNSWAPKEMRQMVIDVLEKNLRSWLDGGELNRLDL